MNDLVISIFFPYTAPCVDINTGACVGIATEQLSSWRSNWTMGQNPGLFDILLKIIDLVVTLLKAEK
jgi:hypothetical protein